MRTMSSVQPPLSSAIWSSWHMLTKGVIFMAIRMMRLIARSISVTRLIRLLGSASVDYKGAVVAVIKGSGIFLLLPKPRLRPKLRPKLLPNKEASFMT